jgi:P-aminobenzoate N-oxygenase AurF
MTTAHAAAARRVSYQLETLWDFAYEPTHHELEALYEGAKKNQWNGSVTVDWDRPIGAGGSVANIAMAFGGTAFFDRFTEEEKRETEIRVSAWRLSQFLHGEQGALLVASQLISALPELDCKKYAATQVVDEARHVEVFERYVKKLLKIYPVDPLLKSLIDEILASEAWELKLLGMQMIIEGLAIAAFNVMHSQTDEPVLRDVLDYVLQDEGRHVNFGYVALRRAIPEMAPHRRDQLEDFALKACDALYTRDERTGFQSIKGVWEEMGLDGEETWRAGIAAPMIQAYNRFLFTTVLIPRLQRLGLVSPRVEPRYREIRLLE